jgi:hypothetical protein
MRADMQNELCKAEIVMHTSVYVSGRLVVKPGCRAEPTTGTCNNTTEQNMPKTSTKLFRSVRLLTLFCCIAFSGKQVSAQGYYFWNPADQTLPFSSEINPALVSKHLTQVAVGLQVFHFGFLENSSFGLRENRVNFSFPYILPHDVAIGFDVRYFSATVYSELAASLLLSREIFNHFSIGVKFALERRGFDSAKFQGVDFSDPLISNNLSFNRLNLGLGASWQNKKFSFGLGLDHVNRPGIGIVDPDAVVPMELSAALGYKIGTFTPTLLLHQDGDYLRAGFAVIAEKPSLGTLRFGYEDKLPFRVEVRFNLSRNGSLGYGVDLPGEGTRGLSAGSHQFVYKHILGRAPELGQPDLLFSTNQLKILEKTVIRRLPSGLQVDDLAAVDEIVPGYLSSGKSTNDLMIVVAGALSEYETQKGMLKRYKRISEKIRLVFQRNPDVHVILRTDDATVSDARNLKQFIVSQSPQAARQVKIAKIDANGSLDLNGFAPGKTTVSKMKPVFSAETVTINIPVPRNTRKTKGWALKIRDASGHDVKIFSGQNNLPLHIEWDWRDDSGKLVKPGRYTCHLAATTIYNNERKAKAGPLAVILIKRKVRLEFGSEPNAQTVKPVNTKQTAGFNR